MPKYNFTQTNRSLAITTPLGENVLLLLSISGTESVSRLFDYHLELLSENDAIDFQTIVGKQVCASVTLADGTERHWNGFISRFSQGSWDGAIVSYHAQMVPWLWFCSRTADCRIFQQKTVPDIVKQIFADLNFTQFELRLVRSYSPREYCVQYRETDFNFVSRLMEEEGIFYFFEHDQSAHKMIIADDCSAHKLCPDQSTAHYRWSEGGWQEEDLVNDWRMEHALQPGKWAQTDYNFETPSTDLMVNVGGSNPYEIYDYPGEYAKRADGDALVKIRLQEEAAAGQIVYGGGNCRAFRSGFLFDLDDHYRSDLNQRYLLTSVQHRATQGADFEAAARNGQSEPSYANTFTCIPASVPFRPHRVTPRPKVQGCQTAVVVGPSGEEIYTDRYGRVKVQFHWDREGKRNENSSCWIRVSHPWAGRGWGAISIPRIGQEVVVDFLEGDPDQPLIVGRVYNAELMPPYGLPGGAVVSGIKSDSTKGGGGYNEMAFDDTKGAELMRIHAQFDKDKVVEHDERVQVKNDRTEKVGNNENITIGVDRTENVGSNESITIGKNRTEKVGSNETITIGSNRTENVGANEKIDIGSNRTESVGSNEMVTVTLTRTHNVGVNDMLNVGAAQEVNVGGLQAITVGAARAKTVVGAETVNIGPLQNISIRGAQKLNVGSNQTIGVTGDKSLTIGKGRTTKVGQDDKANVGKTWAVEAGDQIAFKTGSASIVMKKDGTIAIQGKDITIKASGKVNVKATGEVTVKGKKIGQN